MVLGAVKKHTGIKPTVGSYSIDIIDEYQDVAS